MALSAIAEYRKVKKSKIAFIMKKVISAAIVGFLIVSGFGVFGFPKPRRPKLPRVPKFKKEKGKTIKKKTVTDKFREDQFLFEDFVSKTLKRKGKKSWRISKMCLMTFKKRF